MAPSSGTGFVFSSAARVGTLVAIRAARANVHIRQVRITILLSTGRLRPHDSRQSS